MRIAFRLLALVLCLMAVPLSASANEDGDTLLVVYLEFPPYYYTTSTGRPEGFLLRKTANILRVAGIKPRFQSMPAKRILQLMHSEEPVCSIGWFKTPQREQYAQFSRPIYQNKPLEVLYLINNNDIWDSTHTLAGILADHSISLGVLEGYSLGAPVDEAIARARPGMARVNGDYAQLVRMLAMERFDCILVAPEEKDSLIRVNGLPADIFGSRALPDIPSGNMRHLMFSRGVPASVIERVNQAIKAVDTVDIPR
ncbi:transporter substrate-binding domain-containing protein [Pseudodesulfovibrio sp. F-1]|uniref:Transporter substrate-binding domain-containing protein n=1 Tax=Pseudodesulfovibrio alkaliphilus TaxID=2661613 RepID=A0A7K1KJ20_9BACT|nr:transporter substrate-binding domain-containing protein [Pseudodesulfovibrio alkaliphilus]MUM76069.1 transporter substrate-binding domain-containing protein [Pseudodesulfovibrio alkaliphilus]